MRTTGAAGLSRRGFLLAAAGTGAAFGGSLLTGALPQGLATTGGRLQRGGVTPAEAVRLVSGLYANNPFGSLEEQRLILDAMRRALAQAPAGATARLTAFTGIEMKLKDDIIAAHDRGVNVRVSMDNRMRSSNEQAELRRVLGTDRTQRSCFISLVGTGRAGPGNAHAKMFAIDRPSSGATSPFTMVGSSNLGTRDAFQKWNTMYAARRPEVFDFFAEVHEEMLFDQPVANPYRMAGPFGRYKTFVYPEKELSWETDDRYEFFQSIDPAGAKIYTTQSRWKLKNRGLKLAELMVSLRQRGAEVFVNGGEEMRPETVSYLRRGGVDVEVCHRFGNGMVVWPHCKYWAVVAPDEADCKVIEGSMNTGSEDNAEEFTMQIRGRDVAAAYAEHAALVRQVGRP